MDTAGPWPARATALSLAPLLAVVAAPWAVRAAALALGWALRLTTQGRRCQLAALMDDEDAAHRQQRAPATSGDSWDGFVGFFHPFCNAGGGGERVLWAAIRATQTRWPRAKCVVYTGDHDVNKDTMLRRVEDRFNITLHPPTIAFLYLSKRDWVLASTWPRFTLLGQSLGSVVLAWDALSLLVPDVFVDTMGYAFALGLCKLLFRDVPTGAYVHYPTISTDMLDSLDPASGGGGGSRGGDAHAGRGARLCRGAKRLYWRLFARLYAWVGSFVDVVMTNSTWTQAHVQNLWDPRRRHASRPAHPIAVVYPPVAVRDLELHVDVSEASERRRERAVLCIAQFRPEKNHTLVLRSFAAFLRTDTPAAAGARLVLVGSVRNDHDSKRVYQLRLLANELGIRDRVDFHLDASWPEILDRLQRASVGVNAMWNEHFGIGVVEYQAAGLVSVVHDSGGPKLDIVVDVDGEPTGYHATSAQEFAAGYEKALSHPDPLSIRRRARTSARRFTEEEFAKGWVAQMNRLIDAKR